MEQHRPIILLQAVQITHSSYDGITAKGSGSIIEYNTIDNTGYRGIEFLGNNVTVQYNYIKNFCQINHDGGGIYTYNGSIILLIPERLLNIILLSMVLLYLNRDII